MVRINFNPRAAAFYADNQNRRLAALGIDAWWQDATEPENDDLVGRDTAAGQGEKVRLAYPLQVSRTVYDGQRRAYPDRRVMILTRSAFPGQQRYGAATWSVRREPLISKSQADSLSRSRPSKAARSHRAICSDAR